MAKLLLVRHGHVEGIQPERFRGRTDVALSAEGRQAGHSDGWLHRIALSSGDHLHGARCSGASRRLRRLPKPAALR